MRRPLLTRARRRGAPRLDAVDPVDLGVHAPTTGPLARYVEREVDAELERRVGAGRGVVVASGPRLAGTTRSLARAARLLLGDHRLVRHHPAPGDDLTTLAALAAGAAGGAPTVLWIDDAPLSLVADLDRLDALPDTLRVLLTVRADLRHPDVAPPALAAADVVVVPGTGIGHDAVDLSAASGALSPDPGGPVGALRTAAVLRAAVDWARLGIPDPLPRSLLAHLAVGYARGLDARGRPHTTEALTAAVDALGSRRGSPLRREDRGDRLHHGVDPRYTAAADDAVGTAAAWTAPLRLAEVLETALSGPVRTAVGVLALHRRLDTVAVALLDGVALGPESSYGAGLAALETGRRAEARERFRTVLAGDDTGYRTRAAFWLGLDPEADLDERREHLAVVVAEARTRTPVDAADAAYMLAALERDAGRPAERRARLEEAAELGRLAGDAHRHADALVELARLDLTEGDRPAAGRHYAAVLATGDPVCGEEATAALATLDPEQPVPEQPVEGESPGAEPAAVEPVDVPRPRLAPQQTPADA